VEPRRVDLEALLNAHAYMRVERPPLLWEVDVLDEPFIRLLGELIVVGLLHHDVLGELTLNASNVTVEGEPPEGVSLGDYVAITIAGPGEWERARRGPRPRPSRSGAPTSTRPCAQPRPPSRTSGRSATTGDRSRPGSRERPADVAIT
jgi:hypothetical protein